MGVAVAFWLWLQLQRQALGIAWEDSYHHWLIAAQIARTGVALDPLTGTSNGWLPLYHWLAAGWLATFGWHNLGALATLSALLTLGSAALLVRHAGLGAAVIFLFNPITVLNGSLSIVEPLSTLLVLAGALAWQKERLLCGSFFWSLAALADRGSWPLVLLAVGWQAWQYREHPRVQYLWTLLPVVALAIGLWLTHQESERTLLWASVDQQQLPGLSQKFAQLAAFSVRPLALPLALAALGVLVNSKKQAGLALLAGGYLVVLGALVAGGELTGSSRYYLVLVALLAALCPTHRKLSVLPFAAAALLLVFSFDYLQLWLRWVVLGRPSELAGEWLARRVDPARLLITDSPVVAFYSHWPPERIRGGFYPPDKNSYIAAITDRRYRQVYPLLKRFPALAAGQIPPGFQLVYAPHHWSTSYGAKAVRVFVRQTGHNPALFTKDVLN